MKCAVHIIALFVFTHLLTVPAWAQGHDHSETCPADSKPSPILSVADFDGNGKVTGKDLNLLARRVAKREYIAFFDRNADGILDRNDLKSALSDIGRTSTALDRELASLFWSTEKYRSLKVAVKDGFRRFTERFSGHGEHWAKAPVPMESNRLDTNFEVEKPEGLNYDENGNLVAVFYYYGADPTKPASFNPALPAPEGFSSHQDQWHHHAGSCFLGLNYNKLLPYPPLPVFFKECTSPIQCQTLAQDFTDYGLIQSANDVRWNPKFFMLHVWLYKLNPCGTFAGAHPNVAPGDKSPETSTLPHLERGATCDFDPSWL